MFFGGYVCHLIFLYGLSQELSNLCHCVQHPWKLTSRDFWSSRNIRKPLSKLKHMFWENGVQYPWKRWYAVKWTYLWRQSYCKVMTIENEMSVLGHRSPGRSTPRSARTAGTASSSNLNSQTFRCGHHRGLFLIHMKDQWDLAVGRSASWSAYMKPEIAILGH